jgi:hypothetical protein
MMEWEFLVLSDACFSKYRVDLTRSRVFVRDHEKLNYRYHFLLVKWYISDHDIAVCATQRKLDCE